MKKQESSVEGRERTLEARKQLIMNAAIECFVEKGYHQTGIRDIAKHANVSIGNVYNHFPGKLEFLLELVKIEADEKKPFLEMLKTSDPARIRFHNFVSAYARYYARSEIAILEAEITAEALRVPNIAMMFLDVRATLAKCLASLLEEGSKEGIWHTPVSYYNSAQFILDMIENAALRQAILRNDFNEELEQLELFLLSCMNSQS